MTPRSRWEHARAGVIALVLLAHGIYALPLPPGVSERRVAEAPFQRDLDPWLHLFALLHLPVDRPALQTFVVRSSSALHTLHTTLKAPFAPAMDLVGANQAWALFAATTVTPDRLEVAIRRGGSRKWEVVLRRLDPCCTWREPMLEYRRIRGVWDGMREAPRAGYKGLTKWIAARAFDDFPDATEVRVRLVRRTLSLPGDPPIDDVSFKHERVHHRSAAP